MVELGSLLLVLKGVGFVLCGEQEGAQGSWCETHKLVFFLATGTGQTFEVSVCGGLRIVECGRGKRLLEPHNGLG